MVQRIRQSTIRRLIWVPVFITFGAITFWIPDVFLHRVRGRSFSGIDIIILTLGLPLLCIAALKLVWQLRNGRFSLRLAAGSMVIGIWATGPFFMAIGWSFSGGGLATQGGWDFVKLGTLLFPIFTFMGATYDGTLFALGLTTLGLGLIAAGARPRMLKWLGL